MIIPSAGGAIPRQGIAKEKIIDIKILSAEMSFGNWADMLENDITDYLGKGYQPMPNTYSMNAGYASIVMMKTKMEVEMV